MCRGWTQEETTYLRDNWGIISVKTIARTLNRSESSVLAKKDKLKLGAFLDNGDYITLNQLMKAVGYSIGGQAVKRWVDREIPIINKKVNNNSFKAVRIDDFWIWAEENQKKLDFSKFERYILGKEPDWVEAKRQKDILEKNYKRRLWTEKEDERLIFLVSQYKYNCTEIAEKMQRTEDSIRHRLHRLKIKTRPVAKEVKNTEKWTKEEVDTLKELIKRGYDYKTIKSFIPTRTIRSLRTKTYVIYGTGNLEKVRKEGNIND
ncbi:MAG: hypothetical protein Q606_CBAC00005G0015 [Intestinibacter bartlettii DORA_8_9]|nr:MAG: hypothetical protein Q606_CBAC00005G0015 [Intestinibacter bartlettii DORA_8_9]